jgi:hypothetical protein
MYNQRFAFPWWFYTTEQFHRHARFVINFRYQPSPDEASYLQPYSYPKDALRYIPDIALAKYVTISNVAAHADPIETWVPLVFKRAHRNNQPTLALLREKTPTVMELHIHFNISGRETGATPLAHLLLDTLRTHPRSLQQLVVSYKFSGDTEVYSCVRMECQPRTFSSQPRSTITARYHRPVGIYQRKDSHDIKN